MRNQNATNQKANKYLSLFYDRSLKGFIKLTYFNAENSRKGLRVVKEIAERLETELTGKIIKCPKSKLGNAFEREVLNLIEMNDLNEIKSFFPTYDVEKNGILISLKCSSVKRVSQSSSQLPFVLTIKGSAKKLTETKFEIEKVEYGYTKAEKDLKLHQDREGLTL